ncbi:hypothetical protein ISCGN_009259 [Ixodes scapularis]
MVEESSFRLHLPRAHISTRSAALETRQDSEDEEGSMNRAAQSVSFPECSLEMQAGNRTTSQRPPRNNDRTLLDKNVHVWQPSSVLLRKEFLNIMFITAAVFTVTGAVVAVRSAFGSEPEDSWALPLEEDLQASRKRIYCFFNSSAHRRPEPMTFSVAHINVDYCDDIVYTYLGVDSMAANIVSKDPKFDIQQEGIRKFAKLRERDPFPPLPVTQQDSSNAHFEQTIDTLKKQNAELIWRLENNEKKAKAREQALEQKLQQFIEQMQKQQQQLPQIPPRAPTPLPEDLEQKMEYHMNKLDERIDQKIDQTMSQMTKAVEHKMSKMMETVNKVFENVNPTIIQMSTTLNAKIDRMGETLNAQMGKMGDELNQRISDLEKEREQARKKPKTSPGGDALTEETIRTHNGE